MLQNRTLWLALAVLVAQIAYARDLAIIVEKNNATSHVGAAELEKVLKAGVQTWPDGKRIKIYLPDPDSTDFKTLLQRVYKMTPEEMRRFLDAHRSDIQVAGTDDLVLTLVANNPGAIGVINVYSINSQVKVVKVDEKLPLEQGYLLHGN